MKKLIAFLFTIELLMFISCTPPKPEEKIDHIILVVNNLEKGIAQFRSLTGIEPVFGGVHPNSFTQNALVTLDNYLYIEILAPRTDVDSIPEWIQQFENLTPGGWAAATHDVEKTQRKLVDLGFSITESQAGARTKPDGSQLSWTTFGFKDRDTTVFPFFIQWGSGSIHPASSSPSGCSLVALELISNDQELVKLNDNLALGLTIEEGSESKIVLRINSPKGEVSFPVVNN